jgi:hypothetical protein
MPPVRSGAPTAVPARFNTQKAPVESWFEGITLRNIPIFHHSTKVASRTT